jgi:hypothetical protein
MICARCLCVPSSLSRQPHHAHIPVGRLQMAGVCTCCCTPSSRSKNLRFHPVSSVFCTDGRTTDTRSRSTCTRGVTVCADTDTTCQQTCAGVETPSSLVGCMYVMWQVLREPPVLLVYQSCTLCGSCPSSHRPPHVQCADTGMHGSPGLFLQVLRRRYGWASRTSLALLAALHVQHNPTLSHAQLMTSTCKDNA